MPGEERIEEESILPQEQPKEQEQPPEEPPKEESPKNEPPKEEVEEPAVQPSRNLTLEDVIALSKKGDELSYKDFELYFCEENDKGNRREYQIGEQFKVVVDFDKESQQTWTIYLLANDCLEDAMISLCEGEVEKFIAKHRGAAQLDKVSYEYFVEKGLQRNYDLQSYAEKHGTVVYFKLFDPGRPKQIKDYYVRINTMEEYLECIGEEATPIYNEAFFETKSLIFMKIFHPHTGDSVMDYRIGKRDGVLYVTMLRETGSGFDAVKESLVRIEIPKDQLVDITKDTVQFDVIERIEYWPILHH